jgi:hypothetical protein
MHASVYTRERKHIGSIWSRVTCLALSLAAAQSLERQTPRGSQSRRRLTIVIENKYCKQINKHYIKQYLMTKKIVPKDATCLYEHVSIRIT